MKISEFGKRWIQGMKTLSVENQLKANISFCYGNLFGFTGGIVTMGYFIIVAKEYRWWWTILILFIAFASTFVDLISKTQQLNGIKDMQEQIKILEQTRG